ncbi:MAG: inorganic phosphate transporter family protein [Lactobacillales bacterium]|nr:inorganic phosphate transporter family protein [Lactobacillales bacterium]
MTYLFLFGGIFLAGSLGRNNLSNLFGLAIGTRMVRFYTSVVLASLFVLLGAVLSGSGTTGNLLALADLKSALDAFVITFSAAAVLTLLTHRGLPVSIVQAIVGALIGYNLSQHMPTNSAVIREIVLAWIYSPFLSLGIAFFLIKLFQRLLKRFPIRILYQDMYVRAGLIVVGCFSAYALGANNISGIVAPYLTTSDFSESSLIVVVCFSVAAGFFFADRNVIKTVSSGIFPLPALEAFIVVLSTALTLFLFSSQNMHDLFERLYLPAFPLVPVSMSHAMIGAIVGVSLVKGRHGLKLQTLNKIIVSWFLVPFLGGLISYLIFIMIT